MEIDNFDIVRKHLDFIDTKLDRYIIHILRRPKDLAVGMKNELGSNEAQRLIRSYYVDSIEYFDRKIPAIKQLCIANNARAYIIVQPKDNFECLLNLGKKIFDTIQNKNYSVKPEHLIRQAYCEWHKTRKKQWILDLDNDEMYMWTKDEVKVLVAGKLADAGKSSDDMYEVRTKHGVHIVTSPFNLAEAQKECCMMYEGCKKGNALIDVTDAIGASCGLDDDEAAAMKKLAVDAWAKHELTPFNPAEWIEKHISEDASRSAKKELQKKMFDITGWLHKDGMTLLYLNDERAST